MSTLLDRPHPPVVQPPEAEQPANHLGASLRTRWRVVLLVTLMLGAAGVAAGLSREPTYVAESDLSVGEASLATQSTPGYAEAVQNLAGIYSRLVGGETVLADTARDAKMSPASLRGRLEANPVPRSSVFRITTEGPSAKRAVEINRAATNASLKYIDRLSNSGSVEARKAYQRYIRATRSSNQRRAEASTLAGKNGSEKKVAELRTKAAGSDLIARASAQVYQDNRTPTTEQFKGAVVLSPATSATDDRQSYAQRFGLLGIGAGLIVGSALAMLLGPRRREGSPHQ